ncbi:MAG: aspartate carbamoyltransferase regulatory subunit [Candidatus Cloacimonetes bacterium]|jgi:aspartate carbamoyltransferase regulatory subunit|nr:aspartate carbamoyltransferase regulatory subunit [Candidatus Cloacimonadota bacterium]MBT6994085.1 aspartate carbamoyltransferase regulatory subunit [Candidatus Cloacimonadota bacterium]MBT7469261.1 aspartate carbamoyltransferase regulatory subunit [Candidatus Cloacimonadota bacterium]
MRQIKVNAIKNGTVIDHIPAGKVLRVIDLLTITGKNVVMMGMNLSSGKIGKKDILKIENRALSDDEVNSVALIAPQASLIIIKDFEVIKKEALQIPTYIEKNVVCPNVKCISNEEEISSKFKINVDKEPIARCVYCEKKYKLTEIRVKI